MSMPTKECLRCVAAAMGLVAVHGELELPACLGDDARRRQGGSYLEKVTDCQFGERNAYLCRTSVQLTYDSLLG